MPETFVIKGASADYTPAVIDLLHLKNDFTADLDSKQLLCPALCFFDLTVSSEE
jgi:hypothetical protein